MERVSLENLGVEVDLVKDFNIIREILERMGIANKIKKEIYPSCNILHKAGRYFIVHFKELFLLDGKDATLSEKDKNRRDSVAYLLWKWGLVDPINRTPESLKTNEYFFILKKEERESGWMVKPKYKIGRIKKTEFQEIQ
jgi:hypothetical protein